MTPVSIRPQIQCISRSSSFFANSLLLKPLKNYLNNRLSVFATQCEDVVRIRSENRFIVRIYYSICREKSYIFFFIRLLFIIVIVLSSIDFDNGRAKSVCAVLCLTQSQPSHPGPNSEPIVADQLEHPPTEFNLHNTKTCMIIVSYRPVPVRTLPTPSSSLWPSLAIGFVFLLYFGIQLNKLMVVNTQA